jgi:uncharacterized protein (TIGR02117 family)
LLASAALGACSAVPPASAPLSLVAGPADATVYVIDGGWHTDLGFPAAEVTGALRPLTRGLPDGGTLLVGFGERDYMLAADKGFIDMLRALTPGPGVLLVTPIPSTPAAAFGADTVIILHVSRAGLARLLDFVWHALAQDAGMPRRIADGTAPGSVFYAASAPYSAAYTCNTWTADALASAGLPISADGVVLASQVMRLARAVATGQRR